MNNSNLGKIAITGASGLLGTALIDVLSEKFEVYASGRTLGYQKSSVHWKLFNLEDIATFEKWLVEINPNIIIHCAAMTNVDACETQVQSATFIHEKIPEIINTFSAKTNAHFIYISTDAVFDGAKQGFYTETDLVNPLSIYGLTKRKGELNVLKNPNGLIVRTNIFGWNYLNRQSFAEWIYRGLLDRKRLTMFQDVFFTPIHVTHLAKIILLLIENHYVGLINVTGKESISKYQFALKMAEIFSLDASNVIPCNLEDVKLIAKRPKNMCLSVTKLSELNINTSSVNEGLLLLKKQFFENWLNVVQKNNRREYERNTN